MTLLDPLLWFSSISFLFYGIGCFTSRFMMEEFIRYGIPKFRKLTGVLQLLGALGIIVGFWMDYFQILSTFGLSLLMLFGVITRIKIKDGLMKTIPALFYCLLNGYLCFKLILNFMG
ncbi:DoxX family protein [Flavobacteriaceae bacterium]|nr:DoxX family protein [Flavobacteriaceae bacterium]